MSNDSKTPRTDEQARSAASMTDYPAQIVKASFARTLETEISTLRAELEQWTKWGMIEVAIRNPNVNSWMEHWEGRAIKAEVALKREQEAAGKARQPLALLLDLVDALYFALDDSEEIADGKYVIEAEHAEKLVSIIEQLDELPDDKPGYTMDYNGKVRWALRFLTPVPDAAQTENGGEK